MARASENGPLDTSSLSPEELRRATQLQAPSDRHAYLTSHVLLRELLAERLGCAPADVVFRREPCPLCGELHGRPALRDTPPHFSLSRSGELILVALADAPVGVDVEAVAGAHAARELAPLLHREERAEIERRPEIFTQIWARKEAYLKALGCGIAGDLAADYLGYASDLDRPAGLELIDLELAPGYAGAVAVLVAAT
jgi:4'-phosphopantetheinyl transferase